jgi:DnaJ-class molecular chaperone
VILLVLATPAAGFLDQILNQMNNGQGGQQKKVEFPGWPKVQIGLLKVQISEKIGKKFEFLKNTQWDWNRWNKVVFEADGTFRAPTEECEGGGCRWSANKGNIYIVWGDAGLHTLKASALEAERGTTLDGERNSDGDKCSAEFIGKVSAKKSRQQKQRQQQALPAAEEEEEEEDDVDLYAELGLDEEATDREIKKAFRKLSVKYHPDKNPGNEDALKQYRTIADAYEVLGNADKKILYDSGGMKMVEEAAKEDAGGGRQDPFAAFFGGGRQKGKSSHKGQDYRMEMAVSLEDMYNGNEIAFQIRRRVVCRGCRKRKVKGKDGKKVQKVLPKRCGECTDKCPAEVKTVLKPHPMMGGMMVQQQEKVASKEKCKEEDTKLTHTVEKGMSPGAELKFPRMSEQKPGEIPGDVIVTLKQKEHTRFERKGNNLHAKLQISLKEALLGFHRAIQHLDGRVVPVARKEISSPFDVLKLQGQGMPVHEAPSEFGDLFVELLVQMPVVGAGGKGGRGEGGSVTEEERMELGRVLTPGFVLGEAAKEQIRKEKELEEKEEQEEQERQKREAMEQMEKEREAVQKAMDDQLEGIEEMRFDDDDGEDGEDDEGEDEE